MTDKKKTQGIELLKQSHLACKKILEYPFLSTEKEELKQFRYGNNECLSVIKKIITDAWYEAGVEW